jgi:hypothetical protein
MMAAVFIRISGIALALAVAALLGCGGAGPTEGGPTKAGPTDQERAAAWNSREGPAWAAYKKGWTAGGVKGCEAVYKKAHAENPQQFDQGEDYETAIAATCPFVPGPDDMDYLHDVYPKPPANSEVHGLQDGVFEGCVLAYSKLGRVDPVQLCQP